MRRRPRVGAVALAAILLGVARAPVSYASSVLLISVDGLRADAVTRAAKQGLKVPVLGRFLTNGSYAEGVVGVTPTVTYPSHTTLVTGVAPAEHGIYANGPYDPMLQNAGGWYWYARDLKVPTLWQAVDAAGLVTASVSWPVTVAAPGIRYNLPEFGVESPDRVKALEAVARPDGLLRELEAHLGPYTGEGTEEGDEVRTRFALAILKRYRPAFMTVHLLAVDHRSHEHGPFGAETRHAVETDDGLVGQLLAQALANDPGTVVAVVSDHGFSATERVLNLRVPFVRAGLITLREPLEPGKALRIASWKASIWNAGGSAAVMLKDPSDEWVRGQVKQLLERLKADPNNGIARILGADEAKTLGGWPGASFVVDMKPDTFIGGDYAGPLVVPAPSSGQHGYLPTHSDMQASFLIMGHGIAAARDLGIIDMRQIAPTLARVLNVKLPQATMQPLNVWLSQ